MSETFCEEKAKSFRRVLTFRGRTIIIQVIELRCRQCNKMLGVYERARYVEIKCKKCGTETTVINI
jgi:ribosomal protein S27E